MKTFPFQSTVINSIFSLWTQLSAALVVPIREVEVKAHDLNHDRDFDGWLHGDPFVTRNPTSRYGERSPGYMTSNGLGSLEIGAADD